MSKQNEIDIRAVVKAHIAKKYGTQKAAAQAWGVSGTYVSRVLAGDKMMPDFMANDAGYKIVQREAAWVRISKRAAQPEV